MASNLENGATIGRTTPQERGEVGEDSRLRKLLERVTDNWRVKFLLVPTLLLVASLPRGSALLRPSSSDVCFNKWELLGCAPWGEESFNGGPGSDDCSVVVIERNGEYCVYSGPYEAPNPFEDN